MAQVLKDPSSWTPELARFTADVFDAMAGTCVDERGSYRVAPSSMRSSVAAPLGLDGVWRSEVAPAC